MDVELHGTGTINHGSELMAIAVAQEFVIKGDRVAVPYDYGSFNARAKNQMHLIAPLHGRIRGRLFRWILEKGGASYRDSLGVLLPGESEVMLDASGFAFSDQWGPEPARWLLRRMLDPSRCHQRLILLPQALGPFENRTVNQACRRLFERCHLVFARDQRSYDYLVDLDPQCLVQIAPDFTIGVDPQPTEELVIPDEFVAIVPNARMVDKSSCGDEYITALRSSIDTLCGLGKSPCFVLHDRKEDLAIANQVCGDRNIPILSHSDPRVLKWILGQARFVIGSRFHALVGSLGQGVPSIALGWSHKYVELFKDFGVPNLCVSTEQLSVVLEATIDKLSKEVAWLEAHQVLLERGAILKQKTRRMWRLVREEACEQE